MAAPVAAPATGSGLTAVAASMARMPDRPHQPQWRRVPGATRKARRAALLALPLVGLLAGCSAGAVTPRQLPSPTGTAAAGCPAVAGTQQIDVDGELDQFGLHGQLPPGHCDYDDVSGLYSPGDHFVIVVWPEPPAGLLDAISALAGASGFDAQPTADPQFPDGEVRAWSSDTISGAVISFDRLPSQAAPAGYEAWVGKPLAWAGLHAPSS